MRQASSLILISAFCFAGCASQAVQLTALPGQEAMVRDGIPSLVSKKNQLVMLRPNNRLLKSNARPAFTVAVRNLSAKPETLLETNITAQQSVEGKIIAMRVHKYDDLVKEEQTRQAVQAFGVALSGAARAYSATNAGYVNTTGSVTTNGPYGTSYGSYSATTYDPLRAQIAQQNANAQTHDDIASLQEQGEQNLSYLQNTILKDNTVMPGEWIGGTIVLDSPQYSSSGSQSYKIIVEFAGEQHEFLVAQVTQ